MIRRGTWGTRHEDGYTLKKHHIFRQSKLHAVVIKPNKEASIEQPPASTNHCHNSPALSLQIYEKHKDIS